MIPPLRIALSGGGMRGLSHIGALQVLESKGLLRCVKEYVGTSVGALVAFAIAIGYTLSELRTLCILLDFTLVQNLDPEIILQFTERWGFDDGSNVEKFLGVLLRTKEMSPDITFEEFVKNHPDHLQFRVYTTDIHTGRLREFSFEKTPRAKMLEAVRASMCIPLMFTPIIDFETGHFLVDGGLIAHFPFHHLSDAEREETLGIAFTDVHSVTAKDAEPVKLDMFQYFYHNYCSVYTMQNDSLYEKWGHRIILIDCGNISIVQFDASIDVKTKVIEAGKGAVEEWLANSRSFKHRMPSRRYSVP